MDIVLASNEEEGYPLPEGLTYVGPQERHDYDILLVSCLEPISRNAWFMPNF